ncbi:prepilin peptidase-dependent protein [Enterobacter sp. Tr-810]|uniref:prepilin peptidase-dependent protein n=1 Tax=Enterobacter sp. Tr-810 TaxID=2608347 RepID=UPI001419443A|nr:prepilin peptidase-dependent protein [Enterobacter sp. Tr-810]NIF37579.1 prepilin peptidase-dependent protein [Enterobacter sp. Tr-810]
MKKQTGFTLIETLVAISLVVILSAAGLYSWNSWQQQQRLWQTASQVRDYLVFLRNDANRHNREHKIALQDNGESGCLFSSVVPACEADGVFVLKPLWPEVTISELTPALGFYGLRDTAWAGHVRVSSGAGEWLVMVSNTGRIRMCNTAGGSVCR